MHPCPGRPPCTAPRQSGASLNGLTPPRVSQGITTPSTSKLEVLVKAEKVAKTDTIEQVAMICECTPEEIVIQKLGEKEEGPGKSRTYMDCTVTHTNHPIRPKDQTDMPGIGDQELVMSTALVRGTALSKYGLLKFDVKGAHHVVRKKRRCWKFLVVWVGGYLYIFKVGAFGDGSAGDYWG